MFQQILYSYSVKVKMLNLDVEVGVSGKDVVQIVGCILAIKGFIYFDERFNDGKMTKGIKEAFLKNSRSDLGKAEKSKGTETAGLSKQFRTKPLGT